MAVVKKSLKVLVVEDEVIVAWDVAETLKRLAYEIAGVVDSADRAIAVAEEENPDLILMDIRINGIHDGIEAAELIRARTGKSVVYLTAHADVATMKRAAATQPLGYIFKPFSEPVLRTALERAVARLESARAAAEEPPPKE